jgi:hypothetical protein
MKKNEVTEKYNNYNYREKHLRNMFTNMTRIDTKEEQMDRYNKALEIIIRLTQAGIRYKYVPVVSICSLHIIVFAPNSNLSNTSLTPDI